MKLNYKAIAAGTIFTGAVITPISMTLIKSRNSYNNNPYKITIASSSGITTLNKFKSSTTDEIDSILGLWNSALVKGRPSGDDNGGLETALSIPKLNFSYKGEALDINNRQSLDDFFYNIDNSRGGRYVISGNTFDLASGILLGNTASNNSRAIGFNIRDTKFWNGDRLTAEDFIETIKIALNVKNAVPWQWQIIKTLGIKNAKKIVDAQNVNNLSFEEALKKYPLGIHVSDEIPLKDMSNTKEGKDYYAKEYSEGKKRHSKIIYTFEGNNANTFLSYFAKGVISSPTSIRHFEKVGLNDWGTSIDNLMGIGPYRLEYFDLDYKLVANKWKGYWDVNKVISPQIEIRVIPDGSSQIQMFRNGAAGKVTFGEAMLPQFLGDSNLRKFVKPTNWAESLSYISFNTKAKREKTKYLIDSDFRNAIQYAINRSKYLSALAADNSYPAEAFSTLQNMTDNSGNGPINNSIRFNNSIGYINENAYPNNVHVEEWNKIYNFPGNKSSYDLFTRDEYILKSLEISKNDKSDKIYNSELAKAFYKRFKTKHPKYAGITLNLLVSSSLREQITTIKQDIEEIFPDINIKINSKPENIVTQFAGKMNWDLRFSGWSQDYADPWTYYHLVTDKIHIDESTNDPINRARLNISSISDGFNLIDYIGQKLTDEPNYFAKHYFNTDDSEKKKAINEMIAQLLKMEATIGSSNPDSPENDKYDSNIWDQIPLKNNGYKGYGGQFDKYVPYFPSAKTWGKKLQAFVDKYAKLDLWKNKDYRFSILYPLNEKLIRDSAISMPITRIRNRFIASKFIGEQNFANSIKYFGWLYKADNIPPSRYPLPGIEAITK